MAAKKPPSEKASPAKPPEGSRKIEEVDFYEYLKNKKERRYIEEIGFGEYLKKKGPHKSP